MKVSHSKLKTWRRCHRAYHYKYVMKLRKKIKNRNLRIGSIVHECLEAVFRGKKYKTVLKRYEKEFKGMFEEERVECDGILPLCEGMVKAYFELYQDDFEPVDIELHFTVPLVEDIELEGYIDVIWDEGKGPWIGEHKTCKGIPDETTRMADIQTVLYWWALPKAGYEQPKGVIWDYLNKKLPIVPEPLVKGGLSKKKTMGTTYEIYLQAIKDNDLDPDDYEDMLEMLKNKEHDFFRRIKLPFSTALMNSVVEDAKSSAIQIKRLGHIIKDRNMTRDCSWCDYFNLCQSDLRGLDSDFLIKKDYIIATDRRK